MNRGWVARDQVQLQAPGAGEPAGTSLRIYAIPPACRELTGAYFWPAWTGSAGGRAYQTPGTGLGASREFPDRVFGKQVCRKTPLLLVELHFYFNGFSIEGKGGFWRR